MRSKATRSTQVLAGLAVAVGLAACGASGTDAAAGFPTEVAAYIESERQMCAESELGMLNEVPLEALVTAEFNADAAPDYLLSTEHIRCTEGGAPYCGSAGCAVVVFMSKPEGGLDLTGLGNLQGFEIVRDGDRDAIDVALHGSVVGSETEYARLRWDGAEFQSAPKPAP